ncbi:methionine synthase [Chondromyces crocatus]|uniref:Methionine synthase n=2 Tax=Chondromyces crocatus TaxID=52 RepID=A0A0K1ERE0_CHOCO|nr:methionine synthase [Chondromyces crocatus]
MRPLLMSCDALAALRALGVRLDPAAPLGRLIRETPEVVRDLYEAQIEAGVDVLCALTWGTAPRALAPIGMAFRAAALTGAAVDLALEATATVSRRVAVAGVLGRFPSSLSSAEAERLAEDYATHATRMAAAGCEILLACGFDASSAVPSGLAKLARRAAMVSANATQLATWVHLELTSGYRTADGESLEDAVRSAIEGGADSIVFDVDSAELAIGAMDRLKHVQYDGQIGFLLNASVGMKQPLETVSNAQGAHPVSLPDGSAGSALLNDPISLEAWVAAAMRLIDAGARIVGGGPGTTVEHLASLSKVLRESRRAPVWRRTV